MARAALGWSVAALARETKRSGRGVSPRTVAKFEADERVSDDTVATLRKTFEREGVVFIAHGVYVGGVVPPMEGR